MKLKQFLRASCASALLLVTVPAFSQNAPEALPDGDGKQLLAVACSQCHTLRPIVMMRDGAAGWKAMVEDMVLRGAQLMPQEADTVTAYLVKNFGPNSPRPKGTGAEKAVSLPSGAGKELVESRCSSCHGLDKITGEKRSKRDWEAAVKNMVDRGMTATPQEMQAMTSYLTSKFGK